MFLDNLQGTLMEVTEAPDTRFRYVVWFDYTRQAVNQIQEGALLAAPNFGSEKNTRRYSVLEVVAVLPTHYALLGGTSGYPGFVVEAARSASEDWEAQEVEATEDTTKIRVVAIPTNLELVEPLTGEPSIDSESNIAMAGCQVRLLDSEYANLIANSGIDVENERNLTTIGTMAKDDNVSILLRIDELYRTHFAVFGFTGVGKSNLLSTIVSKVLTDASEPMKLVFFDLMSEYTVLLLDQLLSESVRGHILTLGRQTLPEGLFRHINKIAGAPDLTTAAQQLERYVLLPKALVRDRDSVSRGLRDIIANDRMAYYQEAQSLTVWQLCFTDET